MRCAGSRASASITSSKKPACASRENDAVVTDAGTLSYRELDRRANQVARYLIEQGVQPGDRVGLLFDKSRRDLRRDARGDEGQRRLCAARRRLSRSSACASSSATPKSKRSSRCRASSETLAALDVPQVLLDAAKRAIDAQVREPLTGVAPHATIRSATSSTRRARPATRRASPSSTPSICNFVRVAAELYGYRAGRPRLPGHDDRLRFLGRGDLGAADGRRDAGAGAARARSLIGRRARRLPARAQRHRDGVLPDLACDDRTGPAAAAHPAGRRRSLPAEPRGALVSPGPPHPQFLRPDRSDRHRDADRAQARQAGHHRHSALDLFDRHPRPERGQGGGARRTRRDRHRGRRPRARLHESRRTHDEEVHPRLPQHRRTIRRAASIAPATSAASTRTARSNTAAASTRR